MKVRYPGAQPFDTGQQDIFFGRDKDIDVLYKRIRLEPLTVLYGKSGTGKSSLLNAGIIPRAEEDGYFEPLRVRFNACAPGQRNVSPLVTTRETIRRGSAPVKTFLDNLIQDEETLWHDVKEHQILHGGEQGLLLLFDQFEELFTYPPEQILAFRQQLAEALFTTVPQRYWDELEKQTTEDKVSISNEELAVLQRPLVLKVALTIRSDRMHLLQQMDDYLPNVLKNCVELGALTAEAATEAIVEPAALRGKGDETFYCPPFQYEQRALDKILDFLTDNGSDKIENTQLQIVCHSIEQKVAQQSAINVLGADGKQPQIIRADDIGDLGSIIRQYYDDRIAGIPDAEQQQAARMLIEEGLIFEEEERRLSLYEGQIHRTYNVSSDTLRLLVNGHLLRAEPSLQGGYTYELSHDTLVEPVLQAKTRRKEEEHKQAEREERRRQQLELERERRRSRRATMIAAAMFLLAAASVGASVWAFSERRIAKDQKEEAQTQRLKAETELRQRKWLEMESDMEKARIYTDAGYYKEAHAVLDTLLKSPPNDEAREKILKALRTLEQMPNTSFNQ